MPTEVSVTLFSADELAALPGSGFGRAFDYYCQEECRWADWSDEWASLRALDNHVGYGRNYPAYSHRGLGDSAGLTGLRAWAWLENVVLGPLRLPWGSMSAPGPLGQDRRRRARYRMRPGRVPDCPLTGFYMDEVILADLRDSIRGGMSVGDAMLALEATVQRTCDAELDSRCTEEEFLSRAADEGWMFTEDGERR